MLHFSTTAEPKTAPRHHPVLERLESAFDGDVFGLKFSPLPAETDELLEAIDTEQQANTMTIEELESRPDADELDRFWSNVVNDFRHDGGIDYSED